MRRRKFFMTLVLAVILLVFMLPAGCAKKAVTKEESMEKEAPAQPMETAKEKEMEDALAKEKARERAAEEQLAREQAGEEAAANAAREASQFEDIHFAFDRFELRPDAREVLDIHAKWLKAHTEYVVRIEGNCDERGTVEYNLALGDRRAKSAMTYLVDLGIDKARISTISYGKEQPLDMEHNEEAWAKNRRDHFDVTKKK